MAQVAEEKKTKMEKPAVWDENPPNLEITHPTKDIIKEAKVTVEWEGSDEETSITHYEVSVDYGSWQSVGENEQFVTSSLSEGEHSVRVKAVDRGENETTKEVKFVVDTEPPSVSITNPVEDDLVGTEKVTAKWSGSDAGAGIEVYKVKFDDKAWVDADKNTSHTFKDLPRGEHSITVQATDEAGRKAKDEVTFEVRRAANIPIFKQIGNKIFGLTLFRKGKTTSVKGASAKTASKETKEKTEQESKVPKRDGF